MDRLFTTIEQTFGALTLRIAVVLFVLYFLGEGFSKLLLSVRDVSSKRRKMEHEKSMLEIVKLRCDIEALKKAHGLDIELPELNSALFEPKRKETPVPLARSFADFLTTLGKPGTVLLLLFGFILQFVSLFGAGNLMISIVIILRSDLTASRQFPVFLALNILVIITTGYLGFYVIRRRLALRVPRLSLAATVASAVSAIALVLYMQWRLHNELGPRVSVYPTSSISPSSAHER